MPPSQSPEPRSPPQVIHTIDMKYMSRETMLQESASNIVPPVKLTWSTWTQPYFTAEYSKDPITHQTQWLNDQPPVVIHTIPINPSPLTTPPPNPDTTPISISPSHFFPNSNSWQTPPNPSQSNQHRYPNTAPSTTFTQARTLSGHPDWGTAPTPASSRYISHRQQQQQHQRAMFTSQLHKYPHGSPSNSYQGQGLAQSHLSTNQPPTHQGGVHTPSPASSLIAWNTNTSTTNAVLGTSKLGASNDSSQNFDASIIELGSAGTSEVEIDVADEDVWALLQTAPSLGDSIAAYQIREDSFGQLAYPSQPSQSESRYSIACAERFSNHQIRAPIPSVPMPDLFSF